MDDHARDRTHADRTASVGATGRAEAPADAAEVRLTVEAVAPDPAPARERAVERTDAVRRALVGAGADDDAVRTTGFVVRRRSPHEVPDGGDRDPDTLPFVAVQSLVVETDDPAAVGELLAGAVEAGATVDGVAFGLRPATRRDLRERALTAAMDDARRQAATVAAGEDLAVGDLRSVSTGDAEGPSPVPEARALDAEGAGGDPRGGPVTVTATVQAVYDLVDEGGSADGT